MTQRRELNPTAVCRVWREKKFQNRRMREIDRRYKGE